MLHGLEDCRTLGVDDAFQSELREGPPWKTACERPHLAGSRRLWKADKPKGKFDGRVCGRNPGFGQPSNRSQDVLPYSVGCGIGVSFGNLPEMRDGQFEIPHLVTTPFSIMNFSEHTWYAEIGPHMCSYEMIFAPLASV